MTAMLRVLLLAVLVGLGAASHELQKQPTQARHLAEAEGEASAAPAEEGEAASESAVEGEGAEAVEAEEGAEEGADAEGAEAEEGAEGEEGEEHAEPVEKNYDAALLFVLLITFMAAYYLVNCAAIPEIQKEAWSLIVNSTAIFLAVMMYMVVRELFRIMFGLLPNEEGGEGAEGAEAEHHRRLHGHEVITTKAVWCGVVTFIALFIILGLLLVVQRNSKLRLKVWGTIGGHMMGFAAIDLFAGQLGHYEHFGEHPAMHLVILGIYIVVVPIMCLPLYGVALVSEGDEDEEQMLDMCVDFFCMGASFIIAMIIRGFIMYERTGKAAEQHPTPDHPEKEIWLLTAAAFIFLFVGVCVVFCQQSCRAAGGCVKLMGNVLSTTLLLSSSWCFLDALNWRFLKAFPVHQVMGRLMVAMTAGIFFILVLLVLTGLGACVKDPDFKKSTRSVYLMMALLVGLSWEHTFDVALESSLEAHGLTEGEKAWFTIFFSIFLVLIFLPGYGTIMLPKHHLELKQFVNTILKPWQVCCDFPCDESTEGDGNDYEEAEEDFEDVDMEAYE
jgi:hypothetical protein